jgi:nitroreductase
VAAVIIGSRPGASCPAEDALLAAGNMLLAAHAMGLGSCLIGYAVEAMRHDRRVKEAVALPRRETVHAVVALGWPDVAFLRPTGRRRPVVRYQTA